MHAHRTSARFAALIVAGTLAASTVVVLDHAAPAEASAGVGSAVTLALIGEPIRYGSQPEGSSNGDTFNATWMPDGSTLITQDDATGFGADDFSPGYMNLGTARLYGDLNNPRSVRGVDQNPGQQGTSLRSTYGAGGGPDKNSGLYSVDGTLYMAQVNYGGATDTVLDMNYVNLIKSTDGGVNWVNPQGATNTKPTAGLGNSMFNSVKWRYADFVMYGKDGYAPKVDRADEFVYLWTYDTSKTSTQTDNSRNADYMWLARIPRSSIADLDSSDVQYYTGGDGASDANWTSSPGSSASIRTDAGHATGGSIAYNAQLRRYVMSQFHGLAGTDVKSEQFILEAPHPWGPWSMVYDHVYPTGDIYPPMLFAQSQTSTSGTKMWGFSSDSFAVGDRYGLHSIPLYLSTSTVTTVESESATRTGGAGTATSVSGYTGAGYGTITGSGQAIAYTVSAASAGSYIVKFRYHSSQTADQRISLYVNGVKSGSYKLSKTEFYNRTWSEFGRLVNLPSGANTISLKYDTGDSATIDIDNLKAAYYSADDAGQGIATYGGSAATVAGGASLATANADFTDGGYALLSASSQSAQWTVNAPSAGYYRGTARYANGSSSTNSTIGLYVNGTKFSDLVLKPTLGWDKWEPNSETVYLNSGSNTIKYQSSGSASAQIDSFTLTPLSSGTTTFVDDSDTALITYTGSWTADAAQKGFIGDTLHYSRSTSAAAQFTFTGTAIRVSGDLNSNHGTTKVYLDGTLVSTIDTFGPLSSTPMRQQTIFARSGLTDASHTIKLEVTGSKNALASDYFTSLDGFFYDAGHTDDFTDTQPTSAWSTVRGDESSWSLSDHLGYLRLTTSGGELWQSQNDLENVWLRNPQNADWTVTTKLAFSPSQAYQQAGLIAYQNDDNYVRVMARLDAGGQKYVDTEKEISQVGTFDLTSVATTSLYLRLVKSGTTYTSYYSTNGSTWTLAKQYTGVSLTSPRIGLIAAGAAGADADFDWFDEQ